MAGGTPLAAVVFDAYGTLLDVHAAMRRHADRLPPDWERMTAEWRQKQLEYTWIDTLTAAGPFRDFWTITGAALDHVLASYRVADPALRSLLMETYRELPAFPDARPTLRSLKRRGLRTAILSNGAQPMLDAAVDAAGLRDSLDAVLSVDPVGCFKPSPAVYALATAALDLPTERMGFVSSNAWDAQAAGRAGFRVFWCNRAGAVAEYGLDRDATVVSGLAALEAALA